MIACDNRLRRSNATVVGVDSGLEDKSDTSGNAVNVEVAFDDQNAGNDWHLIVR